MYGNDWLKLVTRSNSILTWLRLVAFQALTHTLLLYYGFVILLAFGTIRQSFQMGEHR